MVLNFFVNESIWLKHVIEQSTVKPRNFVKVIVGIDLLLLLILLLLLLLLLLLIAIWLLLFLVVKLVNWVLVKFKESKYFETNHLTF